MKRSGPAQRRIRVSATALLIAGLVLLVGTGAGIGAAPRGASATAPANTVPPTISGQPQQGMTLAATSGSWTGSTPIAFSYQWERCDSSGSGCNDIAGATNQTRTLGSADVGFTVRVSVTATNGAGSASARSDPTAVVTAANAPLNTAPPSISGEARQGQTLSASSGTWQGTQPIGYGYQWQRCDTSGGSCGAISGATAQTYTLAGDDVGHTLRVVVMASNAAGSASAVSGATATVAAFGTAPANRVAPAVSGVVMSGQTLALSAGEWSGTAPISYAYSWQRCDANGNNCAAISGASGQSYTLVADDVGHRLRGAVTASNAAGSSTAYSATTPVAGSLAPVVLALPAISGKAQQGVKLTATAGSWSGATPINYYYQWVRQNSKGGWDPIAGAVHATYTPVAADVGRLLFVQIKAQNRYGSAFGNSSHVGPVAAGASAPPPQPALPPGAIKLPDGRISIPVTSVSLPQRLIISNVKYNPTVLRSRAPFVARYRITDTRGYVVRDALVYALALPYGWVRNAAEVRTDATGWATIRLVPEVNLPLRRGAVVIYVRARKPGGRIIAGVTAQRLTQVRVRP
jgi:hypothetical protein